MRSKRGPRGERGATLVVVAVYLPTLLLMAAFVIDVADWWVHKRHLQTQADAAALAGALEFNAACANDATSTEAAIKLAATNYSGDQPDDLEAGRFNEQVAASAPATSGRNPYQRPNDDVGLAINSRNWAFGQTTPADTDFSESPGENGPCTKKMIDVKMTERDVPLFFELTELFGITAADFINTQARVEIQTLEEADGLLPIGVRDSTPEKIKVEFFDEANPAAILGGAELVANEADSTKYSIYENSLATERDEIPISYGAGVRRIGARVIISDSSAPGWDSCDPLNTVTSCYPLNSTQGLGHIRVWPTASASDAPRGRDIRLERTSSAALCGPNAYMLPLPDPFVDSPPPCTVRIVAGIDVPASMTTPEIRVRASSPIWKGQGVATVRMNEPSSCGGSEWCSSSSLEVPWRSGPVSIELQWRRAGATKEADWTSLPGDPGHRLYSAYTAETSGSGPVELLQVSTNDGLSWDGTGTWAIPQCGSTVGLCEHRVSVRVGLTGNLRVDPLDEDVPGRVLRFGTGSGATNGTLNCDPDVQKFIDELQIDPAQGEPNSKGCNELYKRHVRVAPNAGCPPDKGTLHDETKTPQPWDCVATDFGARTNMVTGLNNRILGEGATTCTNPNHWPAFEPDDPRILPMFVLPFNTFQGTGADADKVVKVKNFATFYVTGWKGEGEGGSNPCIGHPEHPDEVPAGEKGAYVVGHYINHTFPPGAGNGNGGLCTFTGFQPCIGVMTK